MTAVLTVLGALGVLRRCRTRHATFRWIHCDLGYGHSGHQHRFGWVYIGGLVCDLDATAANQAEKPTAPSSYTITVAAKDGGPAEFSLGPRGESVRYNEFLVPRRRRWWCR